jgi:hypothetical protein
METSERQAFRKLTCPLCKRVGVIMRILYGMPGEDFDHLHFASGGCIMEGRGMDHDVTCRKCDWSGHRNELDSLISKEMLDMSQRELLDEDGELIYYWDLTDVGLHFEIELYGTPGDAFSMDSEVQFTVPESEFAKIYKMFEIDVSTDIGDAIQEISDSGRGTQLWESLEGAINVVDKNVWMS